MIHLNRQYLDDKCEEMIKDIEDKQVRSSSWIWVGLGAVTGLVLSCLRFNHKETTPFIGSVKKEKDRKYYHKSSKNNDKG